LAKLLHETSFAALLGSYVSLFTSGSTLLCCALPALLAALGAGATLAGLATTFPALIWLSNHKEETSNLSAAMLILSGWLKWKTGQRPVLLTLNSPSNACKQEQFQAEFTFSVFAFLQSVLFLLSYCHFLTIRLNATALR
jgi:hypothetical protein